jgi:glycosyltransferase involved in cell wall biosynthesis
MPPSVHLHVIGTGPLEAGLRQLAQARGVAERVHFQGFRRNVFDYLAHCDALLVPSLHEGLPYTLLEAMALAKPIICSNVGGLAEVLEHDKTALLIPVAQPASIAAALRRLHDDRNTGQRLGAAALRVQQERYSLEAMVDAYIDVYRGVLPPPNHR